MTRPRGVPASGRGDQRQAAFLAGRFGPGARAEAPLCPPPASWREDTNPTLQVWPFRGMTEAPGLRRVNRASPHQRAESSATPQLGPNNRLRSELPRPSWERVPGLGRVRAGARRRGLASMHPSLPSVTLAQPPGKEATTVPRRDTLSPRTEFQASSVRALVGGPAHQGPRPTGLPRPGQEQGGCGLGASPRGWRETRRETRAGGRRPPGRRVCGSPHPAPRPQPGLPVAFPGWQDPTELAKPTRWGAHQVPVVRTPTPPSTQRQPDLRRLGVPWPSRTRGPWLHPPPRAVLTIPQSHFQRVKQGPPEATSRELARSPSLGNAITLRHDPHIPCGDKGLTLREATVWSRNAQPRGWQGQALT